MWLYSFLCSCEDVITPLLKQTIIETFLTNYYYYLLISHITISEYMCDYVLHMYALNSKKMTKYLVETEVVFIKSSFGERGNQNF